MALEMEAAFFVRKELPVMGRFYVVISGVAVNVVTQQLVYSADSWGSPSLFLDSAHSQTGTGFVKVVMPLQVLTVNRTKILKLLETFPELKAPYMRVRVWSLHRKLTVAGGVVRVSAMKKRPEIFRQISIVRRFQEENDNEARLKANETVLKDLQARKSRGTDDNLSEPILDLNDERIKVRLLSWLSTLIDEKLADAMSRIKQVDKPETLSA